MPRSAKAGLLAAPFEGSNPSSTAVIVATSAPRRLTAADDAAFARVLSAARRVHGVSLVRDEGPSRDGQATEALVATSTLAIGGTAATNVVGGPEYCAMFRFTGFPVSSSSSARSRSACAPPWPNTTPGQ